MNTDWAQYFKIKENEIQEWTQNLPEGKSLLSWCLENQKFSEEAYLKWAQNHYGLPVLKETFLTDFPPPLEVWNSEAVKTTNSWTEDGLPIWQWDGVIYIACLEPLTESSWNFPVQYVLARKTNLQTLWQAFKPPAHLPLEDSQINQPSLDEPLLTFQQEESTDSETDPQKESYPIVELPQEPPTFSGEKEASQEDLDPTTIFNTIKTDLEKQEEKGGASKKDMASLEEEIESNDSDLEEHLSADVGSTENPSNLLNINALQTDNPFQEETPLEDPPPQEEDEARLEETSEALSQTELPTDQFSSIELSGQVFHTMPPVPEDNLTFDKDKTIESVPPPSELDLNDHHINTDATIPLETQATQNNVPLSKNSLAYKAKTLSGLLNHPSQNISPEDLVHNVFKNLQTRFAHSQILLLKQNKLQPWRWDESWAPQEEGSLSYIDLSQPSIFKIVLKTHKPFHGPPSPSITNETFFRSWGLKTLPKHVTLVPLVSHSVLIGMLLCVGDSEDLFTTQTLDFALKAAKDLVQNLTSLHAA